jgi:pimeloyl-ACP methyl ester carboxylesterase
VETSSVPLAIINGDADPVVDLDYIDRLNYANIWEMEAVRMEGAGHAPHRERTSHFNEILLRFDDFVRATTLLPIEG